MVKVENLTSDRSGRAVANQFIIYDTKNNREVFQSYASTIAVWDKKTGEILLDAYYYNYSRTTSRYLYQFLGVTSKEFRARLKEGKYHLVDLSAF